MPATQETGRAIGYVASAWPRLSQTFVLNEIIELERRGVRLHIFALKRPGDEPVHGKVARVRAGVTYLSFKTAWRSIAAANVRLARKTPRRYLRALARAVGYCRIGALRRFLQGVYLAGLLEQRAVSRLHAHFATAPTLVASFAHELTGIPYTFTAHARDIYVDTRRRVLRDQMEQADAVVTVTEYNRRYLLREIQPAANGKVRVIHIGLDPAEFHFSPAGGATADPPVILSVARLVEKKGLDVLVEAAAVLARRGRCFRVEIIGSGPLRESLEAQILASGIGDCVKLAGPQPMEVVRIAYRRATLFALPCVVGADGDRDGIPTVLLEAMASGKAVVSTPVSGIPELIDSGRDGLLVKPNHPPALADAIERLLDDQQLCGRLGRAARHKIENRFSIDRSCNQLIALFQDGGLQ